MTMRTLIGYSHAFLVAASDHAAVAREKGVDGEVDGMMCIIALQNAFVGASKVLGADHVAVKACRAEAKDLKNVRDMLTHFDEYALGNGKLQKSLDGANGPFGWLPVWNSPETILIVTRRKGEKSATHYGVALHEAVRSVASLVAIAFESLEMKPSAFINGLVSAD